MLRKSSVMDGRSLWNIFKFVIALILYVISTTASYKGTYEITVSTIKQLKWKLYATCSIKAVRCKPTP
jgi:hypothetical protein